MIRPAEPKRWSTHPPALSGTESLFFDQTTVYSSCIFCHTALGVNQSIESFPVGRRLAFDARKGRLWVVCARCERWNLTPLEERWEAVEDCERRESVGLQ